jgi:hypothetical protein
MGTQVWGALEDTGKLAKMVQRKTRKAATRSRLLKPLREPSLG